jgi:hypothetical protein
MQFLKQEINPINERERAMHVHNMYGFAVRIWKCCQVVFSAWKTKLCKSSNDITEIAKLLIK